MSAQFIEKDGVHEFAVIPFAEYEQLISIAEALGVELNHLI